MDEIVFAKDIETDEMLGIESMNVAPGAFYQNIYLDRKN